MRLAVISDIHGNLVALEAVLADIEHHAPDVIVNLGDCVTSPLWPRETFELLDTLALPTVRGNHDRLVAHPEPESLNRSVSFTIDSLEREQRNALGALPPTLQIDDDVLAVHGRPARDDKYLLERKVDGQLRLVAGDVLAERIGASRAGLVLCGHSHHQHMASTPDGRIVLNPGSVGCPRYADDTDPRTTEASSPHARYAVATRRAGGWSFQMIALDYGWEPVLERARINARPDWAAGFLGQSR
jgi:putative phosphoesterase